MLLDLEGEVAKGGKDFFHKFYVIWNIISTQGWVWHKNKCWGAILGYLKVEGWTWPSDLSWGTKTTILPVFFYRILPVFERGQHEYSLKFLHDASMCQ